MYLKTKFLFKNKERTESSIIVSLSKIRLGTEFQNMLLAQLQFYVMKIQVYKKQILYITCNSDFIMEICCLEKDNFCLLHVILIPQQQKCIVKIKLLRKTQMHDCTQLLKKTEINLHNYISLFYRRSLQLWQPQDLTRTRRGWERS